jgi:hypothetical protein
MKMLSFVDFVGYSLVFLGVSLFIVAAVAISFIAELNMYLTNQKMKEQTDFKGKVSVFVKSQMALDYGAVDLAYENDDKGDQEIRKGINTIRFFGKTFIALLFMLFIMTIIAASVFP